MSSTESLLARHADVWRSATRHAFLDGVRDGSVPRTAFEKWLAQDYLFVGDLLRFQARLLGRTPRDAQGVLAGGLVALEAELSWFEGHARDRGLELVETRHPTTEAYRQFLARLDEEPFEVALTSLWALEQAYLEAWTSARPGYGIYREFVEHWTVPAFAEYVRGLAAAADRAIAGSERPEQLEAAFLETARLERDFWNMVVPDHPG